jgi:cobalt-zinc-cadmium efflux system membrane fusion protein
MNKQIQTLIALSIGIALLLSGMSALAEPEHDHDHDHAHDDKPAAAMPNTQVESSHAQHEGHDHDAEHGDEHEHGQEGHDHDDAHVDEVKLTPAAIAQYGVTTGPAKKTSLARLFIAPARVAFNADAMAHVGSSVTGRVSELKVKLGDDVKQGDVLLIVDSPELGEAQSDYLLKRTTVETARTSVQPAKDAYDRARQLLDQSQGIALAEVQRREAEWRSAEGNLRAAEAATTAAENKLHLYGMSHDAIDTLVRTGEIVPRYSVVAPIGGQVIEREVTLGELVNPDRDALLILADLRTVWVIADVAEARVADARKGSLARIRSAALGNRTLDGTVTYVASALDPNTRSARVRVELTDPTGTLRPGMFAQATILPADDGEAVLAIPEEAVQTVQGGPAVFVPVEGEPNTFGKRPVKIGPPIGGMVQVVQGLNEGDALVVSGSFILKAELGKAGAAHEH